MNSHIFHNNLNLYVETFLDQVDHVENKLLLITNNIGHLRHSQVRSVQRRLNQILQQIERLMDILYTYKQVVVHRMEPLPDTPLFHLYHLLQNRNFWHNYRDVLAYQRQVISDTEERLENIRNDVLETQESLQET